jgi:hypothetical protein
MSGYEYSNLSYRNTHLKLPNWNWLSDEERKLISGLTKEEFISRRTATLLGREAKGFGTNLMSLVIEDLG